MGFSIKVNNRIDVIKRVLMTLFIRIPIVLVLFFWFGNIVHLNKIVSSNVIFALFALVIVGTFLFNHPIHKKKKKLIDKDTLAKIKNIKLFNISDIGYKYKAFSMIESMDGGREIAKMKLKALKLGADAVINVTTNIDNKSTTTIGSVPGMPRLVSGKTTHDTTYYYEGTAIKLKYV